jgi:predicted nucleic acid-binding protein
MASKVFADANLLLDFTLQRAGYASAEEIIQMSIDGTIRLCTTPAVLHIVSYYTAQAYSKDQTRTLIATLLHDIQVIDCTHATAVNAVNSEIEDLEDALQYHAALAQQVDYFLSSDKKLKRAATPSLPIYTASEFLKSFKQV